MDGIDERLTGLLGPPGSASLEPLVTAVINELAAQSTTAVLVLDDNHMITGEPVHASLRFLLDHRPPQLGLVLAARSDPPFALARLQARGLAVELRAGDLRFSHVLDKLGAGNRTEAVARARAPGLIT